MATLPNQAFPSVPFSARPRHTAHLCSICGVRFASIRPGATTTWLKRQGWRTRMRAIACPNRRWSEVSLSGTGFRDVGGPELHAVIPTDPKQTWRAPLSPEDAVAARKTSMPIAYKPDANYHKQDVCCSFLFHEACFTLLLQALQRDHLSEADLRAFMNVLRSFESYETSSFQHRGPHEFQLGGPRPGYWGHERHDALRVLPATTRRRSTDDLGMRDPLVIDVLAKAIQRHSKRPHQIANFASRIESNSASADFLARLPMELREMVLIYLPSSDVWKLRLASRAVATMPLSPCFWQSRFAARHELDFIFEIGQPTKIPRLEGKVLDIRGVYRHLMQRKVTEGLSPQGIHNRYRIWMTTARPTADLIDLMSGVEPAGNPCETVWESQRDDAALRRHEGGWKWSRISQDGTIETVKPLYMRQVALPWGPLAGISVSVVRCLLHPYVSGIRLRYEAGPEVSIGYILPKHEIHLSPPRRKQAWCEYYGPDGNRTEIRGFKTATGQHGINAIAPIYGSITQDAQWAGSPERWTVDEIHVDCNERLRAVKVALDGFKIIAIAVSTEEYPSDLNSSLSYPGNHF